METSTISIIATAAVIAIIIVFTVNGYRKGILRILVSTFALLISVLAASLLTKPVSALLRESSFVGENIESNIKEYIDSRISSLFSEEDQKIINGVGNGTLPDAQEVIDLLNGSDFIEGLVIPDFLKENIISNNTAEEYAELGVSTFSEYITARIVNIVINALTFLLLMIVISSSPLLSNVQMFSFSK